MCYGTCSKLLARLIRKRPLDKEGAQSGFISESSCETIQIKRGLICMKMDVKVEDIFILMASHADSFSNGGKK